MIRQLVWVMLVLIVLLATGLRLNGIAARSLWLDEALSWKLQSFPAALIIERTGEPITTHPPLYFLILHAWSRLVGDSETALRCLSLVFGIGTLIAMFFLLRSLERLLVPDDAQNDSRTTTAAMLACLLLAISNLHIHMSQQVRGYTLASFLTVLSSHFLVCGLVQPRTPRTIWAGYVASVIALIYTHNLGLFSVIAQGLFAVLYLWSPGSVQRFVVARDGGDELIARSTGAVLATGNRSDGRAGNLHNSIRQLRNTRVLFVLTVVIVIAAYIPWLTRSLGQSEKLRKSWTKPLTMEVIPIEVEQAMIGTSTELSIMPSQLTWAFFAGLLLLNTLLVSVCKWPGLFLMLLGIVPSLLVCCYSFYSQRSIFDARYLMFAQLFWLAGIAWLFSRVSAMPERFLIASIPVTWFGCWCFTVQSTEALTSQPGMRDAVAYVLENRLIDELVIAETPFVFFGAQYYARDACTVRVCAAGYDRMLLNGESQLLSTDLLTPEDVLKTNPSGIWVLSSSSYMSFAKSQFPPNCVASSSNWELIEERHYKQDVYWEHPVEVRHYVAQKLKD